MTYLCEEFEEPEPEPEPEQEVDEEEGPNLSFSNTTVTWETCEKDRHCQDSFVCVLVLVEDDG